MGSTAEKGEPISFLSLAHSVISILQTSLTACKCTTLGGRAYHNTLVNMYDQHPSEHGKTFKAFLDVLLSLDNAFQSMDSLYDGMEKFSALTNARSLRIYIQTAAAGTSYFNIFACLCEKQNDEWKKTPLESKEKQLIAPKLYQKVKALVFNTYLVLSAEESLAFFPDAKGKVGVLCLLQTEGQRTCILGLSLDKLEDIQFEGIDLLQVFAQRLGQILPPLLHQNNTISYEHTDILSAVFNALPDMKFRLSKDGQFLDYYSNDPENDKNLIIPPDDFIGKTVEEVMPPYLSLAIMNNLEKALTSQKVQSIEYPLHINNQLLFYEARICAINLDETVVIVRDITMLKQTQQKLEDKINELNSKNKELEKYTDANVQLEHFAHTVSHDLREPVRTMNSFAQLLLRRYGKKLDEDALEYLDFIVTGASHMNKMITDLLEFSSLSHKEDHIEEQVDIENVINITLASLNELIQQTEAKTTILDPLPTVKGDKTKLHQLFQNLISNAIKFRKKDVAPQIDIAVKERDQYWLFSIQDNGIGIATENLSKIFVLFRRLHSKRVYPGSGIGLSLCKRVVEQHGGRIWVESKLEEGSIFYFTIAK